MLTRFRAGIRLIRIAARMSYKNVIAVILEKVLAAIRSVSLMVLPAALIGLLQDNTAFGYILVPIVLYAVIVLLSDSGTLAFSLLETALGYSANNIAALRVAQQGMRLNFAKTEDAKVQNDHINALRATWIFSDAIDHSIGKIVPSVLLLLPSVYVVYGVGIIPLLLIFTLVIAGVINERKKYKDVHLLNQQKATYQKQRNYVQSILHDPSYGKEIRLYKNLDFIIQKGKKAEEHLIDIENKILRRENIHTAITLIITGVEVLVAYLFAIDRYFVGNLHIANFVLFISSIQLFTQGVGSIASIFTEMGNLINCFFDFEKYTSADDSVATKDLIEHNCSMPEYTIEFRNVSFKYPNSDNYALKNINLTISSKDTIALVGENGSGKSTLVKLLCKLYTPSEGAILINEAPLETFSLESYAKQIAPVFQDFKLHSFSLRENIAFLEKNDDIILSLLEKHNLSDLVGSQGLDAYVSKDLSEEGRDYSGGERQMIAYIRAVYKSVSNSSLLAPMYLLDEPTSALDPIAELKYFNFLSGLPHQSGTKLFITHRMASAKFADRIIVLDDGEIVEDGAFDDLMKENTVFFSMFNTQAQWYEN
jgi:ATP-binding cassette subfamily B protein/ATP-binding cassette subfamily C protein